jgi:hypothetical protein
MEYDETHYRRWETKMTRMAKKAAKEWFTDFTVGSVKFITYNTNLCAIDERYLLTKIQTILMASNIIIDYHISKSNCADPDYAWSVDISFYTKQEYELLPVAEENPLAMD